MKSHHCLQARSWEGARYRMALLITAGLDFQAACFLSNTFLSHAKCRTQGFSGQNVTPAPSESPPARDLGQRLQPLASPSQAKSKASPLQRPCVKQKSSHETTNFSISPVLDQSSNICMQLAAACSKHSYQTEGLACSVLALWALCTWQFPAFGLLQEAEELGLWRALWLMLAASVTRSASSGTLPGKITFQLAARQVGKLAPKIGSRLVECPHRGATVLSRVFVDAGVDTESCKVAQKVDRLSSRTLC